MKRIFAYLTFVSASCVFAAVPAASEAVVTQRRPGGAVITYALANPPAVVTLDLQTNSPSGWVSIGAGNFANVSGDVNVPVYGTSGTIRWKASESWPEHKISAGGFRAVVSAWPTNDPPPYMVVDLNTNSDARVRYYAKENDLPGGGVLKDNRYRTTHMVMRKITAKGVPWTMGSIYECGRAENETPHTVVLDADYYIGVFPVTQRQNALGTGATWRSVYDTDGAMRPVEGHVSYNQLRGTSNSETGTPDVTLGSLIGKLRSRTGIDFDLPTEAQWEFAARAGVGEGYWPDGSPMTISSWNEAATECYVDVFLDNLARYKHNGGARETEEDGSVKYGETARNYAYYSDVGPTNATSVVGSYPPNAWGLYDMIGNIREWCLDWYCADITAMNGAPVLEMQGSSTNRICRGGSFRASARTCRPAFRSASNPSYTLAGWDDPNGYRLCAPCVAK